MPKMAVIGAGLMGSGIAQVAATGGWDVVLRDITTDALSRGMTAIDKSTEKFVSKGSITSDQRTAALEKIAPTTDLGAVSEADIVVEAVFEDVKVKRELFG